MRKELSGEIFSLLVLPFAMLCAGVCLCLGVEKSLPKDSTFSQSLSPSENLSLGDSSSENESDSDSTTEMPDDSSSTDSSSMDSSLTDSSSTDSSSTDSSSTDSSSTDSSSTDNSSTDSSSTDSSSTDSSLTDSSSTDSNSTDSSSTDSSSTDSSSTDTPIEDDPIEPVEDEGRGKSREKAVVAESGGRYTVELKPGGRYYFVYTATASSFTVYSQGTHVVKAVAWQGEEWIGDDEGGIGGYNFYLYCADNVYPQWQYIIEIYFLNPDMGGTFSVIFEE